MDDQFPAILPGSRGLWQPERKYRDVISVLSEGIVIMTREGIQESNASADEILGLHISGQDGCAAEDPTVELFNADGSPLARQDHPCYVTLATGQSFNNHVVGFRRPGDPIKWCSLNTRAIWTTPGDAPDTVVSSVRDVTQELATRAFIEQARLDAEARARNLEIEQRRLEDVLQELQAEVKLREQFVSTLTHDLRTPLSIAMISAQRIINDSGVSNPSHRGAERLLGSIRRLDHMIRDLLDASRLKAGQGLPLQKAYQSITRVVRESCEGLSEISGNRVVFEYDGPNDIEAEFCANGIARVVENLVSNAVKYGAPDLRITVRLGASSEGVCLSVHNFGNPIAEKDQSTLFEPYYRLKGASEDANVGWGLGLSLVKAIIEAHNGRISVASSENDGTRFSINLPW